MKKRGTDIEDVLCLYVKLGTKGVVYRSYLYVDWANEAAISE